LAEMDAVIPWARLLKLIEPFYPKKGRGRQPLGLEKMLRIYFLQQWFDLSDPQAEDELYDSESMRRFARIELSEDVIPDETTILRFRHLLEKHELTEAMFKEVRGLLEEKGLYLKSGTIVDATIISAPSSTKNRTGTRDPEMKQTKKGNNWYFGMKLHIGTDLQGLVHSVTGTNAATHDITQMPALLHGEEKAVFGDRAYWSEKDRQRFREEGVAYRVNRRAAPGKPLTGGWRKINRIRSKARCMVEHPILVVKGIWGFRKTRYRGLDKNLARGHTMFALANLYRMRSTLMPPGARCAL